MLVVNKSKPESMKGRIFFINADAEYGEGRNQNYLRPEDIEKITYVFHNKIEQFCKNLRQQKDFDFASKT